MKLKYKIGNLIEAAKTLDVDVIAHQCNCFCTMGSGIAPQIAKAFPEAQEVDNATERGDINKLGSMTYAFSKEHNLFICNLYGQYDYSRSKCDTNYEALESAMNAMASEIEKNLEEVMKEPLAKLINATVPALKAKTKIGLPFLGAGLANGHWDMISDIIERALDGYDVTVYSLDQATLDKMLGKLHHTNYEILGE